MAAQAEISLRGTAIFGERFWIWRKIKESCKPGALRNSRKAEDSQVEVLLEESGGKTKVTLTHTNIPAGQAQGYEQGWHDFYFKPMKEYFG